MIRRACENDIEKIYELGSSYNPNFLKTYDIVEYLKNDKYIVLVEDDLDIKAFLICYKNIESFELEMIVVGEKYRGKGIGSNLLEHFLQNYRQLQGLKP